MPAPLSPRVFPVDLNDSAERNLGSAVDSRAAFVELIRMLGEGKLVGGLDFLFAGGKDSASDEAMVNAAADMDALVLAVVPVDPGVTRFSGAKLGAAETAALRAALWHPRVLNAGRIPVAETFLMPFPALAQASQHLAHIGIRPDPDGLYRKTPLFFRWEDGYVPSLPLALAAVALKIDPSEVIVDAGRRVVLPAKGGPIPISVDEEGYAWIPYPAPWAKTWQRTLLDKVVLDASGSDRESRLLELWDGGIVFASDITTGGKDFGPTPLESIYPLSGIHTSLLNGILTRRLVADPPPWCAPTIALLLAVAVFLFGRAGNPARMHAGFGALLALIVLLSLVFWFGFEIVPWFVTPAVALALSWIAATGIRLVASHEERRLLESALSRYFPRALAARVLDEKKVDLAPAEKTLTLLFADIAGFTRWSSDKRAELVHEFLSDYLETMAGIIFKHGGTVDKFMGDGILAFFGDPFEQPDHAARGARAALEMRATIEEICERWGKRACLDLRVRIGLNTGEVIVGNLGTATRIEYTVIGSAVNLAERMEANAPENGILVTQETRSLLGEAFEFRDRVDVRVKGYDEPVPAYVLAGEKPYS